MGLFIPTPRTSLRQLLVAGLSICLLGQSLWGSSTNVSNQSALLKSPVAQADIYYALLYAKWGIWHETVTPCRYISDWKLGAQLLDKWRPIGLTRSQCIDLFGHPHQINPNAPVDSIPNCPRGEEWSYEVRKYGPEIDLIFDKEKCVSCAFTAIPCRDCVMHHSDDQKLLFDRLSKELLSGCHKHSSLDGK